MLKLYNTLSRKIEDFTPLFGNTVTMYSCGPTVYDYQHIGHMRRYVGDDILLRVLAANGYVVKHAMNITDVGHLVSDSDTGEDKMEKGAKKFGKSVWDIAKMFEEQFKDSCKALNVSLPKDLMHATDYIKEQIGLIKILEKKGYTYKISDGIYFDTSKFPGYFKLSRQNPQELKKGARVDFVEGKRNISDFALWKFSYSNGQSYEESLKSVILGKHKVLTPESKERGFWTSQNDKVIQRRQMEWDSPWGIGFPGWHIECSAMSLKALTDFKFSPEQVLLGGSPQDSLARMDAEYTLDIHTGGIDHISIHHTNEIAQSETATGKQFVRFWVHHNFLEVEGQKMSKSLGNFYTVQDVISKGFDPMALRYLYLQTHYRQEMNFTWEALEAAQTAYGRLIGEISNIKYQILKAKQTSPGNKSSWDGGRISDSSQVAEWTPGRWRGGKAMTPPRWTEEFLSALNDDLNTPKALAVLWEVVKADMSQKDKLSEILQMDKVLGLKLESRIPAEQDHALRDKNPIKVPPNVQELIEQREQLRKAKDFSAADEIRKKIYDLGYAINDTDKGSEIKKI